MIQLDESEAKELWRSQPLRRLLESPEEDIPVLKPEVRKPLVRQGDVWPGLNAAAKWEHLRQVFLNAKSPDEVASYASSLEMEAWLDWVVKMMRRPSEAVPLQITAVRIHLPENTVEVAVSTDEHP